MTTPGIVCLRKNRATAAVSRYMLPISGMLRHFAPQVAQHLVALAAS